MLGISERLEAGFHALVRVVKAVAFVAFCAVAAYHSWFLLIQWAEMYPAVGGPL
jgi:hypothetical protein